MLTTLENIIDGISILCTYNVQKEMYLANCQIREKLNEYHQAVYMSSVQNQRTATVELARCKLKLENLKKRCLNFPDSYKKLFLPLLSDLEERIAQLRYQRKCVNVNFQ